MTKLRISAFLLAAFLLLAGESCTVKRDCRGHVKHRLANGIWI